MTDARSLIVALRVYRLGESSISAKTERVALADLEAWVEQLLEDPTTYAVTLAAQTIARGKAFPK